MTVIISTSSSFSYFQTFASSRAKFGLFCFDPDLERVGMEKRPVVYVRGDIRNRHGDVLVNAANAELIAGQFLSSHFIRNHGKYQEEESMELFVRREDRFSKSHWRD